MLLSHFIKRITGHFPFCLRVNVLSETMKVGEAAEGAQGMEVRSVYRVCTLINIYSAVIGEPLA